MDFGPSGHLNTWHGRSHSCNIPGLTHLDNRFDRDTIDILKRLSRRPIEPTLDSELLADLGFDSLQVLELVGELEDHFNIAVPLNSLTHIRTVGQIAGEVRRLVTEQDAVRS